MIRQNTEEYEIALKKSEQRFSVQFQNMIDGMAINEIIYEGENPVDWIITDVNPAYENVMNMSRDEVIGKRATEIYGSYTEIKTTFT